VLTNFIFETPLSSKATGARLEVHVLEFLHDNTFNGIAALNSLSSSSSFILSMEGPIERVSVIGAGISGVTAAAHLRREGMNVTVFERSSAAGGIWLVYVAFHFHTKY
jgi:heterodisulfide reductase subunit A-like polyferredoxin